MKQLENSFNHAKLEKEIYQKWENSKKMQGTPSSLNEQYSIMMPPPNVTGSLHVGHALTMSLQDTLARYQRMLGKDVLYQPGTDHAGIATQVLVEKQLAEKGIKRTDLTRDEFLDKVWAWKEQSGGTITSQLRRLGVSVDWESERFSMDDGLSKSVLKVFVKLYKDGIIYRDKRLVNWDTKLKTAISDLEVITVEKKGKLYYILYKFQDGPLEDGTEGIVIATTRPETCFADSVIAVHPEDDRYKHLHGKKVLIPITNRVIEIITDEYPKPDKGSGAVKITPAHDFNDFEVSKRHKMEIINLLTLDGKMNENAPKSYIGLSVDESRAKFIKELEELELLVKVEDSIIAQPTADRTGVVVEPMLTNQWFLDAKVLAKPALDAVVSGKTKFVPESWFNTYKSWLTDIQPWCISRQLWWGHQIPAWYAEDGKIFVAETKQEALDEAKKHYGYEVLLKQDEDVLDTWFSSALWPFSTQGWPENTDRLKKYYPSSTLVTGFDIIFFWVARMMMMGIYFMGDVPFKTVYVHALVRDEKGQKMSKSKGNVIDPLMLIDKYGTDALRFTMVALAAQGRDIRMSEKVIEGYRNFITKIWNSAKFSQMNGCKPSNDFKAENVKHPLNMWIINELSKSTAIITKELNNFRFSDSALSLYQFIWNTFCDWYIELSKPIFSENSQYKKETQDTTAYVFDNILKLMHPFMPYVSEHLWSETSAREDFLMLQKWPVNIPVFSGENTKLIEIIIELITTIRRMRADMMVPASLKIPCILKDVNEDIKSGINDNKNLIIKLARLENIEFKNELEKSGIIQDTIEGFVVALPLKGIVDMEVEQKRLSKDLEKAKLELQNTNNRLNNKEFVSKAPSSVIEEWQNIQKTQENKIIGLEKLLKSIAK